ncbi:hypothetical protein, partial [Singulisphaera acidiphila]|uniref:hypothetical protein n=1 Tax=Singulisphaera acidiphila TaxID=466153 RepID=UPI001ED9025B
WGSCGMSPRRSLTFLPGGRSPAAHPNDALHLARAVRRPTPNGIRDAWVDAAITNSIASHVRLLPFVLMHYESLSP